MKQNLTLRALVGILITVVIFGVPLFLSAWTLDYWQAWLFLIVFSIATAQHGLYLAKNDPALLERRMRVGPAAEKRPAQRIIMVYVIVAFFLTLVMSGIDHRLGWSRVPALVVLIGDGMIALSFVFFYLVCRENSFASATIEVVEGQKVISTGLYQYVRHPMYAAALLMWLGIPLALGSSWSVVIVVLSLPILNWRIVDEEKCLATNLKGYTEYCDKIKYRLIPGLY